MEKNKRNFAFTLAEVLIVLGIIVIVAALTIPTLMMNAQKHEYVTGLKKFYSTWNNGFAQMLADEGVQNLEDTSVFSKIGTETCFIIYADGNFCKPFFDAMKHYFKYSVMTSPSYKIYYLKGS